MFVTLQVYSFPLSLPHGIYQIYKYNFCVCIIPNLAPWVNQYNNRDRDNKIVQEHKARLVHKVHKAYLTFW